MVTIGIPDELKGMRYYYPKAVEEYAEKHACGITGYCSYIVPFRDDDIAIRTYAYRRKSGKSLELIEVARATPLHKGQVTANIYYACNMTGYKVVYSEKDLYTRSYGVKYKVGELAAFREYLYDDKEIGIWSKIINLDRLFEFPKYKYCACNEVDCKSVLKYVRAFCEHPEVEYFGKMGATYSASVLKKIEKDKGFAKYLREHVASYNECGPTALIYAYENKMPVYEAADILSEKRRTIRDVNYWCPEVKKYKLNPLKVSEYVREQGEKLVLYGDYLRAAEYLGLDMTDTKNAFPKELKRMHDLRIDEVASLKAEKDREKKKKLIEDFARKCLENVGYEWEDGDYIMILPRERKELDVEGNTLHHCVGKMGYDQKVIRGESIIGFIRKKEAPLVPYVTCEYRTLEKRISQCYGDHDSRPPQEVEEFAKRWAEWVKKGAKRETAACG